jgi:hypothetical protein
VDDDIGGSLLVWDKVTVGLEAALEIGGNLLVCAKANVCAEAAGEPGKYRDRRTPRRCIGGLYQPKLPR